MGWLNGMLYLLLVVAVLAAPFAWIFLCAVVIRAFVRRGGWLAVVGTVATLVVAFLGPWWALLLFVFSGDEAPPPPAHRVPLAPGAAIARTQEGCASGGCWLEVELTPGSYRVADSPQCSWPTLLDPRLVCWDGTPGSSPVRFRPLWYSPEQTDR